MKDFAHLMTTKEVTLVCSLISVRCWMIGWRNVFCRKSVFVGSVVVKIVKRFLQVFYLYCFGSETRSSSSLDKKLYRNLSKLFDASNSNRTDKNSYSTQTYFIAFLWVFTRNTGGSVLSFGSTLCTFWNYVEFSRKAVTRSVHLAS